MSRISCTQAEGGGTRDHGDKPKEKREPMSRSLRTVVLSIGLLLAAGATPGQAEGGFDVQRFVDSVAEVESFDRQAREFVARTWVDRQDDDDPEAFVSEALAVLSDPFRRGLEAFEREDYPSAHALMDALSTAEDPYLVSTAGYFSVRSLVELSRLEDAQAAVERMTARPFELDHFTPYAADLAFLRAYCQLHNLHYEEAVESLQRFTQQFPNAPVRLAVTAQQLLLELEGRQPGQVSDVADLKIYAGRQLGHADSGEQPQQRQAEAIALLDALIEEAENREQGGGGGGGGSGSRAPSNPMGRSQLPRGSTGKTQLGALPDANPGDAWGAMPPAEREEILQSLQQRFPSRYRQLVEQYFEELATQPGTMP